jgi:hypothetical protein
VRICPNCGFDTEESQAGRVRELRDEGRIHPGRLGADDPDDFAGGPREEGEETLPGEGPVDPRETDAGL